MNLENFLSPDIQSFIRSLDNPLLDMDYHPGHDRLLHLLNHYNLSKPKLRFRIAGTNGKGSTGYYLEQMLIHNGYTVGFYTSPHIFYFNERIRINGKPAFDQQLHPILEKLIPLSKESGVSPFELATALALLTFQKNNVEVEILECGLGAKLDAATAVPADVALITPIGLDHQAWLGDSLAEIANDKAYALHDCRWGFSSTKQKPEVLNILNTHHNSLQLASEHKLLWPKSLPEFQKNNILLAYSALTQLNKDQEIRLNINNCNIAISSTQPIGRLQYTSFQQAHIWLDAAHNRHAIEALLPSLPTLADPFDAILIYTREDRSLQDELNLLRPFSQVLISNMREGVDRTIPTVQAGLQYILEKQPTARILLLGSFTSVAAGLNWLNQKQPQ